MSESVAPEDSFLLAEDHPLVGAEVIHCPVCQLVFAAGERCVLRSFQRTAPRSATWQAVVMHWECLVFGMVGRRVS